MPRSPVTAWASRLADAAARLERLNAYTFTRSRRGQTQRVTPVQRDPCIDEVCAATALADICLPASIDESGVEVSGVHDGDTLRLADGRKVRLLGIDSPELGRDGRPDQAFAARAREHLRGLIEQADWRVSLSVDRDRYDRYGRLLDWALAQYSSSRYVRRALQRDSGDFTTTNYYVSSNGDYPIAIALGNFDGDTDLDWVTAANYDDGVVTMLNDGCRR